jgi:Phage gp6-like head-tail connector protein
MSVTTLALAKADLRVIHADDDVLIQSFLDAAEDEACHFINCARLPSSFSAQAAVLLLVRAKYDAVKPEDIAKLRQCAETLLMPLRLDLGV